MAEQQDPVTHGELVEIVRRLDDRISSMDRSMDDRFQVVNERISGMDRRIDERFEAVNDRISSLDRNLNDRISSLDRSIDDRFQLVNERISSMDRRMDDMNQNLREMRIDIRMLTRFVMGFYGAILAVVGLAFTLYKVFPNIP
ncbi:MAG: hypothetical protein ETSY1_16765 [Candidatus Entotheonella factor]|uniref:t-SNARE coiled-coil homology domain-containing protein n=1 Tax=Entotheonella factor TaxID=1429438 RepID=W4LNJ6_ENTF1|nr:hypothetical protein [Candidatus Entotheonella palauensis]ETW98956.1 MAG: hypothetical protein ETSY1_16765 [Candidatus Entotheonella factor]